jgi:signal transduction histidine kinase
MADQGEQTLMAEISSLKEQLASITADLEQKNRQLEVEAALDKIRVRATAMRSSAELGETSVVLFHQLNELGIKAIRTALGIFDDANEAMELWLTSFSENQEVVRILDYVNLHIHPVFEHVLSARKQRKEFALTVLSGQQVVDFYENMSVYPSVPQQKAYNENEYYYSFFFAEGSLNAVTAQALTEDELNIMIRFTQVFGLIYKRFLDLQSAEAQAREAQIETALERVRSRTMAMQKSDELVETVDLLFEQLRELGENPNRIAVGIVDDHAKMVEVWATDHGGIKLNHTIRFTVTEPHVFSKMYRAWKEQKKSVIIDISGRELDEYYAFIVQNGAADIREPYGERRVQNVGIFSKGILSFITTEPRPTHSIQLLERFAAVFDLTYTRYLDLKLAEAQARQAEEDLEKLQIEKKNTERALAELKSTQAQLIQAEKMASLGELTAGIAHEIKNPLNFVNNFSEINKELIDELKEELAAGRIEQVNEIANDIKENEDKIMYHGKRADGIVKSMLQHSRKGSGKKEPTDINMLCDEYLRLTFHGLRAKDKSFNAKFETDFDPLVPAVEVVPQEIGRVLLNLINNAFYAASVKAVTINTGFIPTVTITTKKENDKILISVKDNGNGIPERHLYKIFNPFFTTKPAGEGTGLGLSLSYDIIKAHGGDINVESSPGKWCKFIVELPIAEKAG